MKPHFVHTQIHQGKAICISFDENREEGDRFCIYISAYEDGIFPWLGSSPDIKTGVDVAIQEVEKLDRWHVGFYSCMDGEPLPLTADPDFRDGWEDARKAGCGQETPDAA